MQDVKYIVVVQCHIVKERCSGYLCEYAFNKRTGSFSRYAKDSSLRFLSLTCGGCCGRAVHRKLSNLLKKIEQKEHIGKDQLLKYYQEMIREEQLVIKTKDELEDELLKSFFSSNYEHLEFLKFPFGFFVPLN